MDDDGVMDHAIDDGGGNHGVPEVIAQGFKIDVRSQEGGGFTVALVNDLEEQRCVSSRFLLQPIKAHLIDQENIGSGIAFESLLQGAVCQGGHEILEHVGGGGIPAPIELCASDEEQGLGAKADPGRQLIGAR